MYSFHLRLSIVHTCTAGIRGQSSTCGIAIFSWCASSAVGNGLTLRSIPVVTSRTWILIVIFRAIGAVVTSRAREVLVCDHIS